MATTKTPNLESEAMKALGPLAKVAGKTAGSLWKIFVRRYIAIALGELLGALVFASGALYLMPRKSLWLFVPLVVVTAAIWDGMTKLINPHYPAMDDVLVHVKDITKPRPAEVVVPAEARLRGSY
jgi:hypothetical protein